MRRFSVALVLLALSAGPCSGELIYRTLRATLETGSLAGTRILVLFSYDASNVSPQGDSYVALDSFNFQLSGVPFARKDIFQGGQTIFRDGIFQNVTASFQVMLPSGAPVSNITFGFGGPGIIGYVDLQNHYGRGSFTLGPPVVHPGFVVDLRSVRYSDALTGPGIEIELYSDFAFPVRDQIMVLEIGQTQFFLSRYARGDLNTVVFTLTEQEFASLGCNLPIIVQYGTDAADEVWDFGDLNKNILSPIATRATPARATRVENLVRRLAKRGPSLPTLLLTA